MPRFLPILLFTFLLLPNLFAMQLPPTTLTSEVNHLLSSAQISSKLDHILSSASINLPSLSSVVGTPQEAAHQIITQAQKARIAIASHVISHPHPADAPSAVEHARKLQDELMNRVQFHLNSELDGVVKNGGKIEDLEWGLHRGFASGVVESKHPMFTQRVLKPERPGDKVEGGWMEKVKAVLSKLNAAAAIRRFRVRRVLRKISSPTAPASSAQSEGLRNVDQLRAKLSAITALKATQAETAAADAKDAAAAERIENAFPIQSKLVLQKLEQEPMKIIRVKIPEPWDGSKKQWVRTFNRHRPIREDWNSIPIPGMA